MKRTLAVITAVLLAFSYELPLAFAHVVEQRARLRGENVVPGPGDANGAGRAIIKSEDEINTICYKIRFRKIRRAMSGHIHQAPKGEEGEVVVKLFASKRGKRSPVEGCRMDIPTETITDMQENPNQYYVQLHTKRYPDGALRGQLRNV